MLFHCRPARGSSDLLRRCPLVVGFGCWRGADGVRLEVFHVPAVPYHGLSVAINADFLRRRGDGDARSELIGEILGKGSAGVASIAGHECHLFTLETLILQVLP